MERIDQIYYEIFDSCSLSDQIFSDFKPEEHTVMRCTAHIVEELRLIRELLEGKADGTDVVK